MRQQGAGRHALAARGNDLYETPEICTEAAIRAGVLNGVRGSVWEPCAGRGAIMRVLKRHGYEVVASDLVRYDGADDGICGGVDFFLEHHVPDGVSAIFTNPPFKVSDSFIRHGLGLGLRVIVLLRAMAIEGAGRSDLIDGHLRRYWVGIDRPPAMHRDGWAGNKLASSGAPFAFFDFSPAVRPANEPIELHRFWWRK